MVARLTRTLYTIWERMAIGSGGWLVTKAGVELPEFWGSRGRRGAGSDVSASTAIRACVDGRAGNAGRDGGGSKASAIGTRGGGALEEVEVSGVGRAEDPAAFVVMRRS